MRPAAAGTCPGCCARRRFPSRGLRVAACRALAALPRRSDSRNERVGQHEPGLRHRRRAAAARRRLAGAGIVAAQPRSRRPRRRSSTPRNRRRPSTATAISILTSWPAMTLEIRAAHQRPIDAGRGNLEPVGALDRIRDVEHRRQRARRRLAVLDRHRAVRALRHDLDGAARRGRTCAPAPAGSQAGHHRLRDGGDAGRHALLDDQARSSDPIWLDRSSSCSAATSVAPVSAAAGHRGNKKERVPGEPTLKNRSDHIRPL